MCSSSDKKKQTRPAVSGAKTVNIDGLTCKIGLNGKVFYLTNGEWRLSTKTPEQILNAIKKGA